MRVFARHIRGSQIVCCSLRIGKRFCSRARPASRGSCAIPILVTYLSDSIVRSKSIIFFFPSKPSIHRNGAARPPRTFTTTSLSMNSIMRQPTPISVCCTTISRRFYWDLPRHRSAWMARISCNTSAVMRPRSCVCRRPSSAACSARSIILA